MCGITGAFRIDGGDAAAAARARPAPHDRRRSTTAVPTTPASSSGDGCSLGARRLSIIDVEGGHQPFANESGRIWAAQNGEIYNHVALRDELEARGHVLRSRCDTEVLPHLYEEHGPALAERLRGMFAVAVWDRSARRGVLIRDRLGIKPLYYAIVGDVVVFGSELKCVIASGLVERRARPRGDRRLPDARLRPGPDDAAARRSASSSPGERLVVEDGARARRALVELPGARAATRRARRRRSGPRSCSHKLDESVRMRLMSDVPLGAMLSGGLDSSLIVALMARHMDRAGQDVRRRLRRRGLRAARRAARGRRARRRPPRARGRRSRATPTTSRGSSGTSTSRSPTSRRSASSRSRELARRARDGRALRPGRRRAASAATASTASPRWPSTGARCPARCAPAAAAALRRGPGRAGAARRRAAGARSRSRACSRRAGSCTRTCAAELFGGALAEHAGRRRARRARPPRRRARRRAARGRALPRRPARPRRRHAHLLRPRLDGLLARGPRAVPRPRVRRALRARSRPSHKVRRLQGKHVLRLAARGPRARTSCSTSASAASSTRPSAPGSAPAAARSWTELLLGARPRLRAGPRPRRGASAPSREWRAGRRAPRAAAARARHARAVARRVPAARLRAGPRAGVGRVSAR